MAETGAGDLRIPLPRILGARTGNRLSRDLKLDTVGDLLHHFPRRYVERGRLTDFSDLPLGENVTLVGRVLRSNTRKMVRRRGFLTEVEIEDDSGTGRLLGATFFNAHAAGRDLKKGRRAMFAGRLTEYQDARTLTHPDYVLLSDDDEAAELAARPVPIYPAAAKTPSWAVAQAVAALLDAIDLGEEPDPVPDALRRARGLMTWAEAMEAIHRPADLAAAGRAGDRLRYQEALVLQTALAVQRQRTAGAAARPRPARQGGLAEAFDGSLPFPLTPGQEEVGRALSSDLAREHPMQRLLQGEVGSGKTLVALRAMLQVVDAGGQAAFLAPTEVLAEQHAATFRALLGPLGRAGELDQAEHATRVALLTGSLSAAQRRRALADAAGGAAGIVVGTHALLSEAVGFQDLGLVVVDEQHRFGVEQRDELRARAGGVTPHLLVMTATPIPRTVAMTVFGDLEVSELAGLPAGRSPIATHTVQLSSHPGWEQRLWARAREEIDAGRQVFVVCPRIGEGGPDPDQPDEAVAGGPPSESVHDVLRRLQAVPALAGVGMAALHGRMDAPGKAATMDAFHRGELPLLVATTVIEVGVDVPNASMMVILDADRFGMAQLHQLRGRIGRGRHASVCLLVTRLPAGHPSLARLEAVAATTDGRELARQDLLQRREGDILGGTQSGVRTQLRLLRVIRDAETIAQARDDALRILAEADGAARADALLDHAGLDADGRRLEYLSKG